MLTAALAAGAIFFITSCCQTKTPQITTPDLVALASFSPKRDATTQRGGPTPGNPATVAQKNASGILPSDKPRQGTVAPPDLSVDAPLPIGMYGNEHGEDV